MNSKKLCEKIEQRKDELYTMLSDLIKINSENFGSTGNEAECAEYIHNLCKDLGLESDIFSPLDLEGFTEHPDYMEGRSLENRYSVVARYRGATDKDELMLMGHIDTVPIGNVENWDKDPLSGEISDGKIFGRGSCDDKYAIAVMLFLAKLLKDEGFTPSKNLLLCSYSDEEAGGSHGALSSVLKYPCERIISMDGRRSQIWNCATGGGCFKYTWRTKETVDSAKLTASAIPIIIEEIEKFADRRRNELRNNPYYEGSVVPETAMRYTLVRTGGDGGVDLDRGSIHFAVYTDKSKEVIMAELDEIENILAARLDSMGMIGEGFVPLTRFFHYVHCAPDSEDILLMLDASKEAIGKSPIVCGSCLSDLSVISKYGSSRAFAFGAAKDFGDEGGPHQANEFIECDKLLEYTKVVATYILKVLG